jgi:hypothetical protein
MLITLTISSGVITAIIRFVSFLTVDLRSDVSLEAPKTMKWTITEPAMYQIAATLPTLRPILTKTKSSLSSLPLFSKLSHHSHTQKNDDASGCAVDAASRNQFVKLDDYHYMHNSKGSKGMGRKYSGVLKTTDVSVSSHVNNGIEEHELTPYGHQLG